MELYYARNDQQQGPVDLTEFNRLRSQGRIRPQTLVFAEGMADWMPLEQAESAGFVPAPPPPPSREAGPGPSAPAAPVAPSGATVNCPTCGQPVEPSNLIPLGNRQVCPACRDRTLQQMREGVATSRPDFRYAGFWIRFASYLIDYIVMQIYGFALQLLLLGSATFFGGPDIEAMGVAAFVLYMALAIVGPAIYYIWFMGHPKTQGTPGMLATKLRIIRPDGARVTYLRAAGRYFASWISSVILMIGYLMMIWDEEKRTLHDRIADTRIIHR